MAGTRAGRATEPSGRKPLRPLASPVLMHAPVGASIRTRLRLSAEESGLLWELGCFLGSLASKDLAARCRDGRDEQSADRSRRWAERKRSLTEVTSSRWAGSITGWVNGQYVARREAQTREAAELRRAIALIEQRLALPLKSKGAKGRPGGYRSRSERRGKQIRMDHLEARLRRLEADHAAGVVHMVRGGRGRASTRHHLTGDSTALTAWRAEWEASRLFLQADGEAGKPGGNDTIRVDGEGRASIRLPRALEHYANAPYGRYVIAAPLRFAWRSGEWAQRQAAGAALAYRITFDPTRGGRWYVTCSWTAAKTATPGSRTPQPNGDGAALTAALAHGAAGVDLNADHLAVWRLDRHGNPVGRPKDFPFDLSGTGSHRDAQIRQTITRLLQWCGKHGVRALVIEDLDFTGSKSRDRHGHRKFRHLISAFPTAIFKGRLRGMATRAGMDLVAVDPAYSSLWGAQHWRAPTSTSSHETTRHQAASLVIGRRAFGYSARRRRPVLAPMGARREAAHRHRSDGGGHRDRAASRYPVERGTPAPVPDPGGSGGPRPSPGPGTAHAMRGPQREDPRSRNGGTSLSPTVQDRPLTSAQGDQSALATQRPRTV